MVRNNSLVRLWFILAVLSCLLFSGCLSTTVMVQQVKENPAEFAGKSISVQGRVTDTLKSPFEAEGAFRIFDEEGKGLWVFTDQLPLPERGLMVVVTGKLREKDDIQRRIFGLILVEEKRRVEE